ncbi:MAG: Trm112 family protein [Terriglobales bacterium]
MAVSKELLDLLVCPADHATVRLVNGGTGLKCEQCGRIFPIRDDIPVMLLDEATREEGAQPAAPHG